MQFNKNKAAFIHQWYPFVEGYSKEFISSIIDELSYKPECALDPFAGSGTTPVELQDLEIKCHSFEVSPFMHLLASVKLDTEYSSNDFLDALITVGNCLNNTPKNIRNLVALPKARTFQRNENLKKWVFHNKVMDGILDIKYSLNFINNKRYIDLFKIALASVLLDVSNVYRNGKCLSYKHDWKRHYKHRKTVHKKFLNKLINVFQPDIEQIDNNNYEVSNKQLCIYGDVRKKIDLIPDDSIDLVITSPPYLNSRDYTDIYMAELWMLDLVNDYESIQKLRKDTFISHVQIIHGEIETLNIAELNNCLSQIEEKEKLWNKGIPKMIKGYFRDMDLLFSKLRQKMQGDKKVFFNVANSAYYGVEIKVDEIVSSIAETYGFSINEIREARQLKPSGQQKEIIKSLRESVIVMTSPS